MKKYWKWIIGGCVLSICIALLYSYSHRAIVIFDHSGKLYPYSTLTGKVDKKITVSPGANSVFTVRINGLPYGLQEFAESLILYNKESMKCSIKFPGTRLKDPYPPFKRQRYKKTFNRSCFDTLDDLRTYVKNLPKDKSDLKNMPWTFNNQINKAWKWTLQSEWTYAVDQSVTTEWKVPVFVCSITSVDKRYVAINSATGKRYHVDVNTDGTIAMSSFQDLYEDALSLPIVSAQKLYGNGYGTRSVFDSSDLGHYTFFLVKN